MAEKQLLMDTFFKQIGLANREASVLCRTEADLSTQTVTGVSHVMKRAWSAFDLDGMLCIDRRPVVYFKHLKELDINLIRDQHRRFWSHGIAPILMLVGDDEVRVYSGLRPPTRHPNEVNEQDRLSTQVSEFRR